MKTIKMNHHRKGFTLIELIIVVIISGILASIAAPMIQDIKRKAIISEAIMGMNAIRQSLRQYYIEYGTYPIPALGPAPGIIYPYEEPAPYSPNFPGLRTRSSGDMNYGTSDLDGTYFSEECYAYKPYKTDNNICTDYYLRCDIAGNTATIAGQSGAQAPKKDDTYNTLYPGVVSILMKSNGEVQTADHISTDPA